MKSRAFVGSVVPENETRAARKARENEMRERLAATAPPKRQPASSAEPKAKPWGERSPKAWWGPAHVTPRPHRASSLVTSYAYPFLTEEGLGTRGVWMGKLADISGGGDFVFDPYELYNAEYVTGTSMVWIGTVGTGKSAGAKSFACRMATLGVKVTVASDPKGEWAPVAEAMGGKVIALSPSGDQRLNPLDEGPRDSRLSDVAWARLVKSRRRLLLSSIIPSLIDRDLKPAEHTHLDIALDRAVADRAGNGAVTIRDVYQWLVDPEHGRGGEPAADADVAHGMRRLVEGDLAGVFDGESTVEFDADAPMVVMDTSGFMGASGTLLSVAMTVVAAWVEAAVMDPNGGRRILVYDEGWRMLRDELMLLRMSEQWKLARQYGLCNLLVMHRITDLDMVGDQGSAARALAQGLLTDAEIRVVYRQEADVLEATKDALGLTDREISEVSNLPRGMGLWKIGKRPFLVSNILTEQELEVFKTSGRFEVEIPDEILVDPSPSTQAVVSQSQPSPSGWEADTGERSARDEYHELELTRHGNEAGFSGSVTEEVTTVGCDSPDIHAATKPGKYCIRCGERMPEVEADGAAA